MLVPEQTPLKQSPIPNLHMKNLMTKYPLT